MVCLGELSSIECAARSNARMSFLRKVVILVVILGASAAIAYGIVIVAHWAIGQLR